MSEKPIYLDYAATTPLDPEVADAMWPWLTGESSYGNPSSIHHYGRMARTAVDNARDEVTALLHADYSEITFTGSGTEADNLALIGTMRAAQPGKRHLIVSAIEHHAVLHSAMLLEREGYNLSLIHI